MTNYNCLTGEPIKIKNHSSGENKWIGKKDVEKFEIQKKSNVKEEIEKAAVMMAEKKMEDYKKVEVWKQKKLLALQMKKSYTLYQCLIINISYLKITKETGQKFVPMKDKEKQLRKVQIRELRDSKSIKEFDKTEEIEKCKKNKKTK